MRAVVKNGVESEVDNYRDRESIRSFHDTIMSTKEEELLFDEENLDQMSNGLTLEYYNEGEHKQE